MPAWCKVIFLCASCYLLLDITQGALSAADWLHWPLSVVYKAILLLCMLGVIWQVESRRWLSLCLLLVPVIMLVGPALSQHLYQPVLPFSQDAILAGKLMAPAIVLLCFWHYARQQPEDAQAMLQLIMHISSVALLFSFVFGFMGFGYAAYSPMDQIELAALGSSGFLRAANEVSALLLVLTAFQLHQSWQRYRGLYVLLSTVALFCALQLLTKTALLGVVSIILFVPLLHLRAATRKKGLWWMGISVLLLLVLSPWWLQPVLTGLGLYDKLSWVYQEKGMIGLILSSRDLYMQHIWQAFREQFAIWHQWLGVGQAGIQLHVRKYFAESDAFDVMVFFGVVGMSWLLCLVAFLLWLGWRCRGAAEGRIVLMLNLMLVLLALVAGHVLTSGMLWLPWMMWNAWLLSVAKRSFTPSEKELAHD
ncbi:O-antigen ligase family protein [Alkalimonas collagenimarina]|uniref:O-antigen ligase family protein n=1 Tax=Alkalimonas collagenimarina TaxID=400390 RepID=A0ABT9H0A5_9GAMM|nr:O-antigen ligase family protein [Alkalimonas collagenimarina]MDP4536751.1 O-antigen ligase family protein [Alkalimonas collagenimarina]